MTTFLRKSVAFHHHFLYCESDKNTMVKDVAISRVSRMNMCIDLYIQSFDGTFGLTNGRSSSKFVRFFGSFLRGGV